MSRPPLREGLGGHAAQARSDHHHDPAAGRPAGSQATWYLWDDRRVLVNMDEDRKRLEHLRNDPRVAPDVLDESDWHTHVSITGSKGSA